ncbi:mis18-binding protein 1-like isoform X2 [Macrotis lagotis]|uniref:mis18-binding protein 1-like isoform X2 n=1 Tax=Macrotis lagotis TaxID=92651 RepID=UPI003D68996A
MTTSSPKSSFRRGNAPINADEPSETLKPLGELMKQENNLNDTKNTIDPGEQLSSEKERRKTKSLLASEELPFKGGGSVSVELQRIKRDVILTSPLLKKSKLDKTLISGSSGFHKVLSDDPNEEDFNRNTTFDLDNSESPLKIYQPHKISSVDHSYTETIKEALIRLARLLEDKKRVPRTKTCLNNNLFSESNDAHDELSQSTNTDGISTECIPPNTDSHISICDSEVPTEGLLEDEMNEENGKTISDTVQENSTSEMHKVLITTPKTHIVALEKTVSKSSISVPDTKKCASTMERKEICLQKWMIRIMYNKIAVCVEGELIDTPDSYRHSNAIVERLNYNKLRTITGNIYVLKGTIDRISMKEAGFPDNFTRKFMYGFPKKWKQYINDLLQELRAFTKKEKKCKFDQQEIDKYVFERMKKSDTSEEIGIEISKNARTKNAYFDVSEICPEIPVEGDTLPRATELNMFLTDQHHKILPLKLGYGNHNNFDNQMNVTFQTGGKHYLSKEESTTKNESKQMTSPKKTKNHEAKINETIFKSLKRVRKNIIKDTIQELIKPSDTQSSREEFFPDTEKMECMNNIEKQLSIMLTPMSSRKILEQKHKDHNLSNNTIRKISELTLPKNKVENGGNKTDFRKNKSNRLLKSLEKTFGSSLLHKNEDGEDNGLYAPVTINQKMKIPSPPKEQNSTSDSEKKIKKSLRLKRIEPFGKIPSHKIQTKLTGISNQESETEEEFKKKTQLGMKTRQKDNKETVVDQLKSKRKDTSKSQVILEHENEESNKNDFFKKPTSSSSKTIQKISDRKKFSSAEVMGSRRTKEQPLECFPDLIKENNWTEKELQKFQGALSPVLKQKHGFRLNVASTMGLCNAEEFKRKHLEEPQGKGSRKHAIKKIVPNSKVSNGTGVDTNQPVRITARMGPLKRKQKRDFLEQLPKDDHDDMFSESPLHNQRIQLPNFEVNQDDDFLYMDRDSTTPSVIYVLAKTPQCQHASPGMWESINRKDYDKYLYQMQKENKSHGGMWANVKKKLVGSDFTTPTPRRTQFKRGIQSDSEKLFSHIRKLNFEGDYFSDSDSAELNQNMNSRVYLTP